MRKDFALVSVGVAIGLMLVLLAFYSMLPLHAGELDYSDPIDYDLDPDLDAISLSGRLHGETLEITLEVRGEIDSFQHVYQIQVIARFAGGSGEAHIYNLDYYDDMEHSYWLGGYEMYDRLVLFFPLGLLIDDAYIVGLEAFLSGFSGSAYQTDFVNAGNREDMTISYALDIGVEPLIPLIAGAGCIGAAAILFITKTGVKLG